MISPVSGLRQYNNYNYPSYQQRNAFGYFGKQENTHDIVQFTGKSNPSEYLSVFDYMAANILENNAKYGIKGDGLSKKNIKNALKKLFESYDIFGDFKISSVSKIKWKSYIPFDVRDYSVRKINDARIERLNQWKAYLLGVDDVSADNIFVNQELVKKLKNNKSLKFVIWNAITSEIKDSNRHIPVPFDEKALLQTIQKFERILPIDRRTTCSKSTFLGTYTHRLRDNLLSEMGLTNNPEVWVKIPSINHDKLNAASNISHLEILSNGNWCTRSSVDKARAALEDGDFYIYLKRDPSEEWEPLVGMACSKGKIDQIQGPLNNNIVPINLLDTIKYFISSNDLKCASGVLDEGPKALQAIKISEKLSERVAVDDKTGISLKKTFYNAINEKDAGLIFKFLDVPVTVNNEGMLSIGTYRPHYLLDKKTGITIPYSMFGVDENALLRDVVKIDGNFYLNHKNPLYKSRITKFPPNLEIVTGKIYCSKEQYALYQADMERVVDGDTSRIIVSQL